MILSGPIFSLSMFNTGAIVITYDTHLHFSNYYISEFFALLGEYCLYNSDLSIPPPIIWVALMIAS